MIRKLLLLFAHGVLCVLEFLVGWAKEEVSEMLKGKQPKPPEE